MAVSPSDLSVRSGSSISASSSSSSLSSLYSKGAHSRTLPRRGQIKAAIFASIFSSIAHLLGAKTPDESENGANSQDGAGSHTHMSDFRMDVDGGLSADEGDTFGLSVSSSPVSGSVTPNTPFKPLSRPRSFDEGMHRKR